MEISKEVRKHRLSFTDEELRVLEERLAVVNPNLYTLQDFATLRNLYGRITHIMIRSSMMNGGGIELPPGGGA
ncbi:MAG TPA: hypothetical protein VMW64_06880 [Dehalococcoidia bacterium]|nr:hypothetical protein [Dehalococcoidia bacterium]